MAPKLKIELLNNYMFVGWMFVIAGLIGGLYYLTTPGGGQETILGLAVSSFLCGLVFIYLGYTKRTVFKRKK